MEKNAKNPWFRVRYVLLRALPAAMLAGITVNMVIHFVINTIKKGNPVFLLSGALPALHMLAYLALAAAGLLLPFDRCRQAVRALWGVTAVLAAANAAWWGFLSFTAAGADGPPRLSTTENSPIINVLMMAAIAVAALLLLWRSRHARVAWIVTIVLTVVMQGVLPLLNSLSAIAAAGGIAVRFLFNTLLVAATHIFPVVTGLRPAKE